MLCVYTGGESKGSQGTLAVTPEREGSLSSSSCGSTGGAGRVWMSNLYSFPHRAPFSELLFCTGDQSPRGVKLLFANFNLAICEKFGGCLVVSFFVFVF